MVSHPILAMIFLGLVLMPRVIAAQGPIAAHPACDEEDSE